MSDIKGTIKISDRKVILKTKDGESTYIKSKIITDISWIEVFGEVYQLDKPEDDSEL